MFFLILMGLMLIIRGETQREYLLLFASYIFYGAWNPFFILLIMVSSLWGWCLGILMYRTDSKKLRKRYMWISLLLNLSMLGYFKYANFFVENLTYVFGVRWDYADIVLPVGISFFTFQTMSYTIDLYRGNIPVCSSLRKFMLFVAFFPQLVAGPIVRASEFLPQLSKPIDLKWSDAIIGGQIFLGGVIQKVLVADNLSVFVDPVFMEPALYSPATLWLAVVSYSIQIFCDFSGYSLMAIGVARILGYKLPKNFDMPYVSSSITEFWRRWHITLSFWLRDYLYIPLGGNRAGVFRTYLNLAITMLLGGLWHGASWNFVVWGGMHGIALAVHKLWCTFTDDWMNMKKNWVYRFIAWCTTISLVGVLWVPFRSSDFSTTVDFFSSLLPGRGGIDWFHPNVIVVLLGIFVWHVLYLFQSSLVTSFPHKKPYYVMPSVVIGVFILLISLYAPVNTSPFIYFQF